MADPNNCNNCTVNNDTVVNLGEDVKTLAASYMMYKVGK